MRERERETEGQRETEMDLEKEAHTHLGIEREIVRDTEKSKIKGELAREAKRER